MSGGPHTHGAGRVHLPVMLRQVLDAMAPAAGRLYVDATFGAGGYAEGLLHAAPCTVLGVDRDPEACGRAEPVVGRHPGRLSVVHGRFGDLDALAERLRLGPVHGVAFDLGVSSPQLDTPGRGFSFRTDGPLDMRMDPTEGEPAADVVNRLPEAELADLIWRLGEERASRRIAAAIVRARAAAPITGTLRLAEIVHGVMPRSPDGIDTATRTFQALRIFVNDELGELARGLEAAERLLAPGGRLVVVAFHSLEDRLVKTFLRARSGGEARASRHAPERQGADGARERPAFRVITRRAVRPDADEVAGNPRARSARMRAAERTAEPAAPRPEVRRRAA